MTQVRWVLVLLAAGCGRLDFDPVGLVVEEDPAIASIEAPGKFRLVFEEAYDWHATGWYDLATDPGRNLAGHSLDDASLRLVQTLNVNVAGEWWISTEARTSEIAIDQVDPAHVVVHTGWTWATPQGAVAVKVDHAIALDGHWDVTARIDQLPMAVSIEYADAHVLQELPWEVTAEPAKYRFALPDGPSISVERAPLGGNRGTDEGNNQYWTLEGVVLPIDFTWHVLLGS
jgi:hypothetical protein